MKNGHTHSQMAFTLIETLLYIALYAILMTGIIVTVFTLIESQDRDTTGAMLEEEGDFLLGKIEWALSNSQTIEEPSDSGPQLTVVDADNSTVSIWSNGGDMYVQEDDGAPSILSNNHVTVTDLSFEYDTIDGIQSIEASFTLNATTSDGRPVSRDFSAAHYFPP